ncbi:hypothetical protein [Paenibacillus validus]|uniref:hypothetical protein n=1 Tax=Paenibacillus validus TaxID=44253 RepID=UPI003D27948A
MKKVCIVFVEYRIEKEYRTSYLTWAAVLKQQFEQMDVYEGAEQPGLFVEIWNGLSDEAYAAMKAARTGTITPGLPDETEEGRLWRRIDPWIAGGRGKVHIWKFTRITLRTKPFVCSKLMIQLYSSDSKTV